MILSTADLPPAAVFCDCASLLTKLDSSPPPCGEFFSRSLNLGVMALTSVFPVIPGVWTLPAVQVFFYFFFPSLVRSASQAVLFRSPKLFVAEAPPTSPLWTPLPVPCGLSVVHLSQSPYFKRPFVHSPPQHHGIVRLVSSPKPDRFGNAHVVSLRGILAPVHVKVPLSLLPPQCRRTIKKSFLPFPKFATPHLT